MGKIYLFVKRYVLALVLLIGTTVILYSCKKDTLTDDVEQKELEKWYNSNKSLKSASHFDNLKPIWGSVYVSDQSNQMIIYEIKLSNPKKVYQSIDNGLRKNDALSRNNIRLLIFKDKNSGEIITGCYMSVLNEGNEAQDLKEIHYKQVKSLNGKVMFFNMDGKLENGWEYNKGNIVKRINGSIEGYYYGSKIILSDLRNPAMIDKVNAGASKLMIYRPPACAFPQPNYIQACVGIEGYMSCTTLLIGYFCSDDPGASGGGGEGGYNPYPGGGGGGTNPSNNDNNAKVDIDPNARQCLKDIKATLEALGMKNNSSTGLISNVLNSLNLSTGSNFNVIITESVISPRFIAETRFITNPYNWGSQGYVSSINFNTTYLDKSTDLKVAVTMMHEYIHAYFDWNLYLIRNGQGGVDDNFAKVYAILFDKSGAPIPDRYGNDAQHKQIADSFVSQMSGMLKSYAIAQNIPIPADPLYFDKMAWAGLQDTPAFKFAPPGTSYTNLAESGGAATTITQVLKCEK